MDFDPRTTKLHSQADDEYLVKYGACLSPKIKVEFWPQDTNFVKSPPNGGVYMHLQILALAKVAANKVCLQRSNLLKTCLFLVVGGGLVYRARV